MLTPIANDIVFFGDSLTDDGNLFDMGVGVVDWPTPFPNGITDGLVHTAFYDLIPGGGTVSNYAVASADAVGTYTLGDLVVDNGLQPELLVPEEDPALDTDINLGAQIDRYLADMGGADLSGTIAIVWIGNNDLGGADGGTLTEILQAAFAAADAAIDAIVAGLVELLAAGVETVYAGTLPVATFFPSVASQDEVTQGFTELVFDYFNEELIAAVEALEQGGASVGVIDYAAITRAIAEDPVGFGLVAPLTEHMGLNEGAVLDSYPAEQVGFADDLHPASSIHGVLAAFTTYALDGVVTALDAAGGAAIYSTADDLVLGLDGNDIGYGSAGIDAFFGGAGNDGFVGGQDGDILSGGSGDDFLAGGQGDDVVDGDTGNDKLGGGQGNDVLIAGQGFDLLIGAPGDDTFIFVEGDLTGDASVGGANIFGGEGFDTLYVALTPEAAALFGDDLEGDNPEATLAALGITAFGIEEIVVLEGADGIDAQFGAEDWFLGADLWGLI